MDSAYTPAAKKHAKAALKKFEAFLCNNYPGALTAETISADDVTHKLMDEFAVYLSQNPAIGYSASSTCLASVKHQLVDRTKTTFFDEHSEWYSRLRLRLRKKYVALATDLGQPLQKKSPLMTIQDMKTIAAILFEKNTAKALKDRSLFAYQWTLIGRGSDIGDLSFRELQWMAHSSRRGSAVVAASSSDVNLSDLAHRGSWTVGGFHTLLDYLTETSHGDQTVARVLGGWGHPTEMVQPPKLVKNSPDEALQKEFALQLSLHYKRFLTPDSFLFTLTASLLLCFSDTFVVHHDHLLHIRMVDALCRCTTPPMKQEAALSKLHKWSSECRKAFIQDNFNLLSITKVCENVDEGDRLFDPLPMVDTLARVSVGTRQMGGKISDLNNKLENLIEQQRIVTQNQQRIMEQQDRIIQMLTHPTHTLTPVASAILPKERISHCWPKNFCSLKGVCFSALVYQYWHDNLDLVPYDGANHAQRDARKAMKIVSLFLNGRSSSPLSVLPDDAARARWRVDAQQLAANLQREVLHYLDRAVVRASGSRRRKLTGSVSGIVKAWAKRDKSAELRI
ncbi:hypothetical protein FI667_g3538, partial [Globisporangium splendens]